MSKPNLQDERPEIPSMTRRQCLGGLAGASALGAALGLGGCASRPQAIDAPANAVKLRGQLERQISGEDRVEGPISLYEAMARALKYNLDQKIEMMEVVLRERQFEARSADQLPTLVAGSGFSARNNDAGSRSRSLLTGRESLEPSSSSERQSTTSELALSWDVLDFGLARVRHRQQADERLISAERRRKVINRILEDVRTAYWRAVSADRTAKKLADLEVLAGRAMRQAEELEQRRVASPNMVLAYQRDLLQVQADVQKLQRELSLAKSQLAALMNLRPDAAFRLVLPDRTDVVPELPGSADEMVLTGLRFRPEVREAAYRQRILRGEFDAAFLRALPTVRTVLGLNHDSNEFLYNPQWLNLSARLSWNLLDVFRYPANKRALDAEVATLDQRDLALTMAVMTQVYVARVRFVRLSQELSTVQRSQGVQERLLAQARGAFKARAISQQQLVREEMNGVLSEVRYDVAYSDLQNAYANLYASMGLDNFDIDAGAEVPLKKLTETLEEHWTERALSLPAMPDKSS
ncbi:TolC family protein [Aquabacterium sp. OR-4]|uniref:TolC family protein n=1 Tax=Aquabacterium sp. OR-4 TaxID=2978127 RepID=UPI0021B3FE48|nr:TolC family protein [Aquabacterium sp. OR-4]MDT7834250.1 TolC family protein [Aquabacterium sp. OR-4]